MTLKMATVFTVLAGILAACGSGGRYEWVPYRSATPSMPLEQAKDVCQSVAKAAKSSARSAYDANNEPVTSGGFWAGAAQGAERGRVSKDAYQNAAIGCMAEKGYQRVKVR